MHPLTIYKASAGSGKTFTLAVQYIKLLVLAREGGEYAHILGVTFTNKATTEMKDRIICQLYGIANGLESSDDYLAALREALRNEPDAPTTDEEIRQRCGLALRQILHDYSRFRIQTIDAFFQTVLRGLAHELGLTANLQVEIGDTEVLSEAVDRIVDRLDTEPVVLDWLYSLVRDQIENNQRWDVTRRVKDFGRAIFNEDYLLRGDQLRAVLSNQEFVRTFINTLREQEKQAVETIKAFGLQLEQTVNNSGFSYSDFSYGNNLESFIEKLKLGALADIEVSARIQTWADDPMTMVKKADLSSRPELLEVADTISSTLSDVIRTLATSLHDYNSARQAMAHIKPLFLLDFIDQEVAEINAETSRFNLAKTPVLLNRMIDGSDAPFIFEKIGALLHHVMIDEFQDTSRLQWENFRVLLLESYSRGGRNLLVGDVKQSIYRWRGGDWRILNDIQTTMHPAPQLESLDINFRSKRRVIQFNNDFFVAAYQALEAVSAREEELLGLSSFFESAYGDVRQEWPEGSPDEGCVRVEVLDTEEYKKREDWEPVVLEGLIQQVRQLHAEGLPYEKMTILVRNNSDSAPIIHAFAAEEDMPAIVSDEAFLLSSCLPINLLMAALQVLDDETNAVALYFLAQHEVDTDQFLQQKEDLRMMPLYELIEHLYLQLNLKRYPGQDAYFFGFFDAVTDYLHNDLCDLHSFLAFWDEKLSRQSIPAGQVQGIRIMTIHKAKGLEFHTVFIPFCSWDFERDRLSSLLWCSPTEAPFSEMQLLPITPSSKVTPNSAFAKDYAEDHLLSRLDELNTLYVAFTRAESNLFVWAVGNNLQRENRTVGDLVACAMTEVGMAEGGVYTFGERITTVGLSKNKANRMNISPQPLPVLMESYPLNVTFRQSNRSQEFMAQAADELPPEEEATQKKYLETGRLLHRVLQSVHTAAEISSVLDSFERQGLIMRTTFDGTQVAVRRKNLERWLQRGLQHPLVATWFTPDWQLFNECSIVSLDNNGQPKVLRPDRVMVSPDGSRVVVVDFKFGSPHPTYMIQVQEYMRLLTRMMPEAKVEGYLWYVYTGKVQPVTLQSRSSMKPSDTNQLTIDF